VERSGTAQNRDKTMKLTKALLSLAAAAGLMTIYGAPVASKSDSQTLPSDPDKAWKEVESLAKPPAVPKEWNGQAPTPEQKAAFQKFLGEQSAQVAAKEHEFYTRFPDHPKAAEAKQKEERFLQQAVAYGNTSVIDQAQANLTDEQKLQQKVNAVQRRAMEKRPEGMPAVLEEFERGMRELIKENPTHPELWQALMVVAQNSPKEKAKKVLADIIKSKADEDTIARAKGMMKTLDAVGQPLEISFTAADGRAVDVQKMKGKVVLIDFWASWCGPCMAALPEVVDLYQKYHPKGLEIVGINLDKSQAAMDGVLQRFNIPWAQYFDGKGWGNKFALEYNVAAIPSTWLVDKTGILRTMEAGDELEKQIAALLAEKL
jgi:thiol-disulfide isomerase/thioredoxin